MKLRVIIFFAVLFFSFDNQAYRKVTSKDVYQFIAINEILMWVANNGDGSYDPNTNNAGFYWPGGKQATQTAVYEDGLVWGGMVQETNFLGINIWVNGNCHRQGLIAGKILDNGQSDDPSLEKYRVYKIRKNWQDLPPGEERDQYQKDYDEWPVEDGAPWLDKNNDGIYTAGIDAPKHAGDETLWYVANDSGRSQFTYGAPPMGLEQQCTVFAFDTTGELGNTVFKKYKMYNKGSLTIDSMYFSYWSDADIGFAGDDYVGCDTSLNLAYCYNDSNFDDIYGTAPPALGYVLLQGPIVPSNPGDKAFAFDHWYHSMKNLSMTAFVPNIPLYPDFYDPVSGIIDGSIEFYRYMRGKHLDGGSCLDPHTGEQVKYMLSGDPVSGSGWYEGTGWPDGPESGDRRMIMSSGPLRFAPGDSQEVVYAIIIARGSDYLDSITQLKEKVQTIKNYYYTNVVNGLAVKNEKVQPVDFYLSQNYPNPFNPITNIEYTVGSVRTQHAASQHVELSIYNLLGNKLATLVNKRQAAGEYSVMWDASDFASSVYIYTLETSNGFKQCRKLILLK